jgi:hypothetical protein
MLTADVLTIYIYLKSIQFLFCNVIKLSKFLKKKSNKKYLYRN